jgi:ribosome-binding factor A
MLPAGAKSIEDLVAKAIQADAELAAARAGAVHAGDSDPYRDPGPAGASDEGEEL